MQTHQVPIDASQLRQAGRAVCREETRTVGAHSRLLLQGQVAEVLEGSCLIFSLESSFLELFCLLVIFELNERVLFDEITK